MLKFYKKNFPLIGLAFLALMVNVAILNHSYEGTIIFISLTLGYIVGFITSGIWQDLNK